MSTPASSKKRAAHSRIERIGLGSDGFIQAVCGNFDNDARALAGRGKDLAACAQFAGSSRDVSQPVAAGGSSALLETQSVIPHFQSHATVLSFE